MANKNGAKITPAIPISNLTVVGGPHTADLLNSAMNAYHDPREAPIRVMIDEGTMRLWFGEQAAG